MLTIEPTLTPDAQEAPLLQVRDLWFSFGERPVLRGVNLRLEAGQVTALTGPSGSGKSTLLALAGLLRTPPRGCVWHWGQDMGAASSAELTARRRRLRFIFQRPYLLRSLTVLENVTSGALLSEGTNRELKDRAHYLLDVLGLEDLATRWPEQISGGQQQRVALARALIGRPDLLLADEPTASLDYASAMLVVQEMRKLAKEEKCGVIVTTHDMRITDQADNRVNLSDGQITSGA